MRYRTLIASVLAALVTAVLVAQAQVPGVNSALNAVFTLAYDQSTMKPTYSATALITSQASSTDICSLSGSATRTVKVRRVIISGFSAVTVSEPFSIVRRSAQNTGAGAAMIKAVYDTTNSLTNSAANSSTAALAEIWTSPTLGLLVAQLADVFISFGLSTALNSAYEFDFGRLGSPVVLRGVAQNIAVNLNGNVFTGSLTCTFEWTEE